MPFRLHSYELSPHCSVTPHFPVMHPLHGQWKLCMFHPPILQQMVNIHAWRMHLYRRPYVYEINLTAHPFASTYICALHGCMEAYVLP